MSVAFNFDKYWGAQLSGLRFNNKDMFISFDLFWTVNSTPKTAVLRFDGVSDLEFSAEKVFQSEVVELISIDGKHSNGAWRITGEFSNYEFRIACVEVSEDVA